MKNNTNANKVYRFNWSIPFGDTPKQCELWVIPSWASGTMDYSNPAIFTQESQLALLSSSTMNFAFNDKLPIGFASSALTLEFNLEYLSQDLIDILLNPYQLDLSYATSIDVVLNSTYKSYTQKFSFGNIFVLTISGDVVFIGTQTNKQEQSISGNSFTVEAENIFKSITANIDSKCLDLLADESATQSVSVYDYFKTNFRKFANSQDNTYFYIQSIGTFNSFIATTLGTFLKAMVRDNTVTFTGTMWNTGKLYRQLITDGDYSRGTELTTPNAEVYYLCAITDTPYSTRDANTKILGGGFVFQCQSDYKSLYDLLTTLMAQSFRRHWLSYTNGLDVTMSNEFTLQADSTLSLTAKDKIQELEVTLFGNLKSNVEAIPNEAVELSLSKYTANKPFAFVDNRSTFPIIYSNLPTINERIDNYTNGSVRFWGSNTVSNNTLYWINTTDFIRVHENASFNVTDSINSDTLITTPNYSLTPNTPNIVNRQNQLLGVAYESGLPRLSAELFLLLFGNIRNKQISFQTNFAKYNSNFDLLYTSKGALEVNLYNLNIIQNKTLFENTNETYFVVESELDFNGNVTVTAIQKGV